MQFAKIINKEWSISVIDTYISSLEIQNDVNTVLAVPGARQFLIDTIIELWLWLFLKKLKYNEKNDVQNILNYMVSGISCTFHGSRLIPYRSDRELFSTPIHVYIQTDWQTEVDKSG